MAHKISKQKKEIAGMAAKELKAKEAELTGHIFQLRMQLKTAQMPNTATLGMARKELARVKTAMTKQLSEKSDG